MNVLALLLASMISFCPQNNIKGQESFRQMTEQYYTQSPNIFCGFATRYGRDQRAIDELRWEAEEVVTQYNHGYVLLAGNYGYQTIDGYEYLLDNRASMGYSKHILEDGGATLNRTQMRLYKLGLMSREEFNQYIEDHYIGVISIKSPNDIGREFCLYAVGNDKPIGTVIVGGTAASKDWLPIGTRAQPETISLGLMNSRDSNGTPWSWAADLPNSLYYKLSYNGEHPHIKLVSGRCQIHLERISRK